MSDFTNDYMKNLLSSLDLIKPDDIPNIDLYMDQVTTFMENHLGGLKRFNEDKILTKTMINNYAKNDLLPAPEKKKYSKDHVLMLTFIYYFKSFLTINDIKALTSVLSDKYFHSVGDMNLERIYNELLSCFPNILEAFKTDIAKAESITDNCFNGTVKDDEYLKTFLFVSLLGIDVYMKKQLIESIIDSMNKPEPSNGSEKPVREKKGKTE